ncbi:MAG: CPBP family intramembrane metalloprotease [Lachnospiraceae bacterium]|nr:CPBP family intramembrane metalloprotease [Lachnospiraceae bacterium]
MEKTLGKEIRHQGTKIGWSLLGYVLITNIVVIIGMFIDIVIAMIEKTGGDVQSLTVADTEEIVFSVLGNLTSNGTSSIIAIIFGIPLLMLIFRKTVTIVNMWHTNRKMSVSNFLKLLSVFMAAQLVFTFASSGIEALLNLLGYSANSQMEWASSTRTTLSMILYVGIFGPVAEEIIYRGFLMKSLMKYGKHFAIVCSAVTFGIMHANIYQLFFAIIIGLVLGYTASEFSLKWAVALHIINNAIFSQLFGLLVQDLPETTQAIILYTILGLFFVAALVIMWKHRQDIKTYYQENKVIKKQYVKFFVSVGMIAFILFHLLFMIIGIQPVQ